MTPTDRGRLHGIHVLVVEDDEDGRYVLDHYLRHHGARVTSATDGRDALTRLQQVRPDVIISDIMMPGMTGLELIRTIRALPCQGNRPTPAIAVSAYPYHHERNEALLAGFDAFLVKPVDPLVIVAFVEALCERDAGGQRPPGEAEPRGSADRE